MLNPLGPPPEHRIRVSIHDNATCIKCGICQPKMLKIGVFHMCTGCASHEDLAVNNHSEHFKEKYVFWLTKYKESL